MISYRLLFVTTCVSYVLYRFIAFLIRSLLVERLTAVNDLRNLDRPRPYRKVRGTAVVCGGSISGLLAAKACAAHFESVIVIEAEGWLTDSTATNLEKSYRDADFPYRRSHVAQYYATHFFQPFLIKAMLKWFPNFSSEVEKKGGKIVPQIFQTHISGNPLVWPKFTSEEKVPRTMAITRPTFETLLRKLVIGSCPNVTYICGSVFGLVKDHNVDDIRGVRIRKSIGDIIVPASLVLDCTGSAMGGFRWLKELAIAEGRNISASRLDSLRSTYMPHLRYATFEFNVPLHLRPRMKQLGYPGNWETTFLDFLNQSDSDIDCTGLGILKQEHNYLQYVCAGWGRPKRNLISIDDLKEFISQIRVWKPLPEWVTLLLDLFKENKVPFTSKSNSLLSCTYIPYHLYEDLPSNFIVIGDSGMTTNPLRAIGCAKACVEAVTLNNLLFHYNPDKDKHRIDKLPIDFSRQFERKVSRRTGNLWETYKVEDYAFRTTFPCKGEDLSYGRRSRIFNRMLLKLMRNDSETVSTALLLRSFLIPFTDLFAPSILMKLAWMKIRDIFG